MEFNYNKIFTQEEADIFANKRAAWIVANIKQQIGWPTNNTLIEFRDCPLLLLPESDILLLGIAFRQERSFSGNEARTMINHYLSSLAWVEGRSLHVIGWSGGGPHPFRWAKSNLGSIVTSTFHHKYLPDPSKKELRIALALYREALSLEHVAYSFLSYYKIINLKYAKGGEQKKWIDQNLKNVTERDAVKRRDDLSQGGNSVSDYIYVSCRCAIAHAGTEPMVDPENFDDEKSLNLDLPLIKNLAELMIEYGFGIKSIRTIHKEHYYELYGFKEIFGSDLIQNLKQRKKIQDTDIKIPFSISIRIRGKKNYLLFEKLNVKELTIIESEGAVNLIGVSNDSLVSFKLYLDFLNERLKIFPFDGIIITDNNTKESSIYAAEYYRFLADYYSNGKLEIWNSDSEECLSQCDSFIPVNIEIRETLKNFKKKEQILREEAVSRKQK